mmetsp:Transcript_105141/g.329201  ORF Transcript_105141/g.329201 Transcript_105141/m.329201 type:complete len:397 (+) Transcript_105141:760-1950(+)
MERLRGCKRLQTPDLDGLVLRAGAQQLLAQRRRHALDEPPVARQSPYVLQVVQVPDHDVAVLGAGEQHVAHSAEAEDEACVPRKDVDTVLVRGGDTTGRCRWVALGRRTSTGQTNAGGAASGGRALAATSPGRVAALAPQPTGVRSGAPRPRQRGARRQRRGAAAAGPWARSVAGGPRARHRRGVGSPAFVPCAPGSSSGCLRWRPLGRRRVLMPRIAVGVAPVCDERHRREGRVVRDCCRNYYGHVPVHELDWRAERQTAGLDDGGLDLIGARPGIPDHRPVAHMLVEAHEDPPPRHGDAQAGAVVELLDILHQVELGPGLRVGHQEVLVIEDLKRLPQLLHALWGRELAQHLLTVRVLHEEAEVGPGHVHLRKPCMPASLAGGARQAGSSPGMA